MKKILVVFTGGTIGSTGAGGTIDTSSNAPFKLLELFAQQYPDAANVHFDTLQPLKILSENLAPAAWKIMIDAIESANPEQYDGIVITHGTDTLAYSAAALSFYFHALKKPILLVSSDYTLENPDGNGLANFMCAVEFIRQQIADGVFVPYRNRGQPMQIHLGSRLTCSLQLTGDFYGIRGKYFLQFDGQEFSPKIFTKESFVNRKVKLKPEFSNQILMIKPYPGLDYSHVNLNRVEAVLHDLYHSGTACASGQWGLNHSLVEFIKRCREQNIQVYLAPALKSENAYQSTRDLVGHGAEIIWNMSIEAAYVKLMLAFGNFASLNEISEFLNTTLAHEDVSIIE